MNHIFTPILWEISWCLRSLIIINSLSLFLILYHLMQCLLKIGHIFIISSLSSDKSGSSSHVWYLVHSDSCYALLLFLSMALYFQMDEEVIRRLCYLYNQTTQHHCFYALPSCFCYHLVFTISGNSKYFALKNTYTQMIKCPI